VTTTVPLVTTPATVLQTPIPMALATIQAVMVPVILTVTAHLVTIQAAMVPAILIVTAHLVTIPAAMVQVTMTIMAAATMTVTAHLVIIPAAMVLETMTVMITATTIATVVSAPVEVSLDGILQNPSNMILDSTAGKLMEKVGGFLHNDKLQERGAEKREQAGGYGGNDNYGSSGNDNNY
jgi:hypothetical protein